MWVNPYNFVQNNPINRIDPNGLTDYTLNQSTGDVKQVGEANDKPDRILKTREFGKHKGEVKYKKNGEAKVAIGGIEQGILKDGMNLKNNDNVIGVGGKGQASIKGFESFALSVSNYIGKEVGGYYLANKSDGAINNIYLGKYANNTDQKAAGGFSLYTLNNSLYNSTTAHTSFHTHLSRFGDSSRLQPSGSHDNGQTGDLKHKAIQSQNGVQRFIIITNPETIEY
jgi:hypothetical protein